MLYIWQGANKRRPEISQNSAHLVGGGLRATNSVVKLRNARCEANRAEKVCKPLQTAVICRLRRWLCCWHNHLTTYAGCRAVR